MATSERDVSQVLFTARTQQLTFRLSEVECGCARLKFQSCPFKLAGTVLGEYTPECCIQRCLLLTCALCKAAACSFRHVRRHVCRPGRERIDHRIRWLTTLLDRLMSRYCSTCNAISKRARRAASGSSCHQLISHNCYLLRNGLPQERLGVGHWSLVLVWCRALADLFIGQPAGICS